MNLQRLIRPPKANARGTLESTDRTIFFVRRKKRTDHKRSPRNHPITNPLREKTWGREGDGSQMRYGQRLARAALVTPMASAGSTPAWRIK